MKYVLINRGDSQSVTITEQFCKFASNYDLIEDDTSPDIVISIGGDGTLLEAFHLYEHSLKQTVFLGIHTGHLGFYSDWNPKELETLISLIATNKSFKITEYPLVSIDIKTQTKNIHLLALNEFVIKGLEKSLVMKVKINDDDFETFRGDGLCISTPSGSTAYNKSIGGALIHPSFESIQLSEIASLNNRVYRTIGSSLLLPKNHFIELLPQHQGELGIALDHLNMKIEHILSIKCKVAEDKIRFIRYRPFPFWFRVRNAFIGNEHLD
ncbi:MAG: NAD kinase [Vulcanibacillus sp.]